MSSALHLDHADDGNGYLGFSHGSQPCPVCNVRCNASAGGRKASARANRTPRGNDPTPGFKQSRTWLA